LTWFVVRTNNGSHYEPLWAFARLKESILKAAVITSFDAPPRYGDFVEPVPQGTNEMLVDVLAVGLHHVTRSRATGTHYSSDGVLPLVPGMDGVGRGSDGKLRYFVQAPGQAGSMADKTVIQLDHSIELPADCDPVAMAGTMNPAMASWLALRCRIKFLQGQRVLVIGATGSSGKLAVQIARHLGASQVIAAGRDQERLGQLPALGATDIVALDDAGLGALAHEVDVVLDFVWGQTAAHVMEAVLRKRSNRSQPLSWIHVGSMAGELAAIPGAFLRSANLQVLGSGHGSVSGREILAELPALAQAVARGTFTVDVNAVPLADAEQGWAQAAHSSKRFVFVP
jgi:NADPH:quinone reductase-like Zn-dependent oxidoreductase